nr:hypothetical protein GCM10020093_065900 [Planobispora longispora]
MDRLAQLVDLLVWVLDPQKYADAAVHDRYLRPLARHRDVMVVVLNQIDRLTPAAAERCLADLRRLLAEDGLAGVPVIGVSARTGTGVPELRSLLASRVADRRSWAARLAADVGAAADVLAGAAHGAEGDGADRRTRDGRAAGPEDGRAGTGRPKAADLVKAREASVDALAGPLTSALSQAAGVPLVIAAVARAHRHRSIAATGWPVTRWIRRFRPDPSAGSVWARPGRGRVPGRAGGGNRVRKRLGGHGGNGGRADLDPGGHHRPALPDGPRDPRHGRRRLGGAPGPWAAAVRHAARSRMNELEDRLDRAVATTSLGASRRPAWWRVMGTVQWLVLTAALAGALWLLGLFAMDYLRLPEPPVPTAGEAPWPTLLLLGGILLGLVLALLSRAVAWLGGRRRARKAARALRASVAEVGHALVLEPVEEELSRYHRFTEAVTTARR